MARRMPSARIAAVVIVLCAALAPVGVASAGPATGRIVVGRSATVDGAVVRLADVALLEGNASDLGAVELGPAPDPGGSRRLDGVGILRRLRDAGLDDGRMRYEIPASVRVARAYQDVGPDEIRGTVERDAASVLAAGEQLRNVDAGGGVRIPPGAYDLRVVPPVGGVRGARRRVDVELVQDGAVVATASARIDVIATGPVVVARHAATRGSVLTAADLRVEERELTGLAGGFATSLADAVGKETRATLAAGAPVPLSAIASPVLVRRGDLVTVVVETPGMRLSTPGEALEPGIAGAAIRVKNRQSQQELSGQVIERGTVLVSY